MQKWRVFALASVLACGCGDDRDPAKATAPFSLTYRLDSSYHAPHGGQPIEFVVVEMSDESIVTGQSGTVSDKGDLSFVFVARDVLESGQDYEVRYWIDSNIEGGIEGVCDAKEIDHQWSTEFYSVSNDISWTTSHNPALTEDVCATFQEQP